MIKRIGTLLVLAAGIYFSYLVVVSCISGYLIGKYGSGRKEGVRGRVRSIMIPLGKLKLHLHHWLISFVIMSLGLTKGIYFFLPPEVFYGFLGGLAFQGVYCYNDWHRIVQRRSANL